MNTTHKYLLTAILFLLTTGAYAQTLTLDSCRVMALAGNKELKMAGEKLTAARYRHKAAFTNFLPKIKARGAWMHTHDEMSLLSDDQKQSILTMGDAAEKKLTQSFDMVSQGNPMMQQILAPLRPMIPHIGNALNQTGKEIMDAFRTDTREMWGGAVTLTQPIFMGGKIAAYNKLTKYAERLAASQQASGMEDIILSTDQAYWQVVSLSAKKRLAEKYVELLTKLDDDIQKMIAQGVATKSDGLSVSVKLNEAEMTLTKVEDGLSLSRMVLCQICGLPLDSKVRLQDENLDQLPDITTNTEADISTAMEMRPELTSLSLAQKIYEQKVNITRSEFLPTVALTGNYLITNPSMFNGFEKKFRDTWSVGLIVQIPVWNWFEGIYKVKAAKAEARIAEYRLGDIREKVELQVSQASFKLREAGKRMNMAERNLEKADENMRTARLGFSEGVISTSDVLAAQTAWLSARSARIDAGIDIRLAETYLKKSMGILK